MMIHLETVLSPVKFRLVESDIGWRVCSMSCRHFGKFSKHHCCAAQLEDDVVSEISRGDGRLWHYLPGIQKIAGSHCPPTSFFL